MILHDPKKCCGRLQPQQTVAAGVLNVQTIKSDNLVYIGFLVIRTEAAAPAAPPPPTYPYDDTTFQIL